MSKGITTKIVDKTIDLGFLAVIALGGWFLVKTLISNSINTEGVKSVFTPTIKIPSVFTPTIKIPSVGDFDVIPSEAIINKPKTALLGLTSEAELNKIGFTRSTVGTIHPIQHETISQEEFRRQMLTFGGLDPRIFQGTMVAEGMIPPNETTFAIDTAPTGPFIGKAAVAGTGGWKSAAGGW